LWAAQHHHLTIAGCTASSLDHYEEHSIITYSYGRIIFSRLQYYCYRCPKARSVLHGTDWYPYPLRY